MSYIDPGARGLHRISYTTAGNFFAMRAVQKKGGRSRNNGSSRLSCAPLGRSEFYFVASLPFCMTSVSIGLIFFSLCVWRHVFIGIPHILMKPTDADWSNMSPVE